MTELEPATRALLALARGDDDPSPAERAENRQRLGTRLAALGVTASALAKTPALSAASLGAKGAGSASLAKVLCTWFALGAVVGGVVQGSVVALGPSIRPAGTSDPTRAQPSGPRSIQSHAPARCSEVAPRGAEPKVSRKPFAEGATSALKRNSQRPAPSTRAVGVNLAVASDRIGAEASDSLPPAPQPLATERVAPDLSEALAVLARVQGELRSGRAIRALAELDGYAERAPNGPMEEERRAMKLVALCQLGRRQGFDDAQHFLTHTAGSPLAARVRAACTR